MRRAARTDTPHAAIRTAFQRMGCVTLDTFTLGKGAPDLFCSLKSAQKGQRITFAVEVKNGASPPSHRKLTPDQEEFHLHWKGLLYVVNSVSEVPGVVKQACRDACGECEGT